MYSVINGYPKGKAERDAFWWQPQNINEEDSVLLKAAFASKEPMSSAIRTALKMRRKAKRSSS